MYVRDVATLIQLQDDRKAVENMEDTIFYYFLKTSVDDTPLKKPIETLDYIGNIGDFIELDGVGYIIEDMAYETRPRSAAEGDSLYW